MSTSLPARGLLGLVLAAAACAAAAQTAASDAARGPAPASAPAAQDGTPAIIPSIQVAGGEAAPADQPTPLQNFAAEPGRIDTIVVTAQKRVEKVQDVPLAVSVVGEEQLRQQDIQTVQDLSRAVSAVEVNGEPGNPDTAISIRGIQTNDFSVTAEQAVSYVVDGVVLGKAPSVNLFDVDRVEVLRGPQGTLFGKNASAGVINVTTNAPDPRKFEAMGHLDMGLEYNEHLGQAMLNLPLTANSALRLSAGQSYVHDLIYNNVRHDPSLNEINGFRARYQWKPLPDLSINIVGDYEKAKVSEQPYIIFSRYNNAKTGQPEAIPGCGNAHVSYSSRLSCNEDPSYAYTGAWGLSGQIEWTVFDQTITSITAGRRYTQDAVLDVDGLPSQFYDNSASFDNKVLSQELRIASPSGVPLEYTAGFYWSKSNVPSFQGALIGADLLASAGSGTVPVSPCTDLNICAGGLLGLNNPNNYVANLTSSALFGQLTWHALDNFRVVAGARLTRDNVNMNSQSYLGVSSTLGPELVKLVPSLAPLIDGVVNGLIPYGKSLDSNEVVKNFSWHSALQYNFTKDLMVFASVTHGYKGPQIVFNPPNLVPSVGGGKVTLPGPPSISIVQPESPMDEEAGVKATVLDGHLAVDFNLFHTIIKDFQAESFKAQGFVPANVSHVITQGAELDVFGFITKGLMVHGGASYDRDTYPHGYLAGCSQVGPQCASTSVNEDVGGTQLIASPRFKATITPQYEYGITPWLDAFGSFDAVYKTDVRFEASTDNRDHTGCHTVVGARLGVRDPDDKWTVAVYARNLFNAYNPAFLFSPYLLGGATAPGVDTVGQAISTESYRFIGFSVEGRF